MPQGQFEQADLQAAWPCAPASADRVCFHLVLGHIADLVPVLGQATTALKSGGQLIIRERHPARPYCGGQAHDRDGRQGGAGHRPSAPSA